MPVSIGGFDVGLFSETPIEGQSVEGTPFRIAILGDFSGRANRGIVQPGADLARRRAIAVDRDNLDAVLARLGVELTLPVNRSTSDSFRLAFKELDDFHPDRIFDQVALFGELRDVRRRLSNSSTFAAAAEEVKRWARLETKPAPIQSPAAGTPAPPAAAPVPSESLMDELLARSQSRAQTESGSRDRMWGALIRSVVEPYVVPGRDPQQPELIACVDAAITEQMRTILHGNDYQSLEACWRGLYFLARRLETGADLSLHLVDVSKAELAADLAEADDPTPTGLYKLLVDPTVHTAGGVGWKLLVGNYSFDHTVEDALLAARLATLASRAGAPFLAAGTPRHFGCTSLAASADPDDWTVTDTDAANAWKQVRGLPQAAYLAIGAPRWILRLPFGGKTDPIERFQFEEQTLPPTHEGYLWGNPGIACACLLAQSYSQYGWSFRPGMVDTLDGLPTHVYDAEGESTVKPCAEAWLTERAIERITDVGLFAVTSILGRDAIRLPAFRSMASGNPRLAGRWNRS